MGIIKHLTNGLISLVIGVGITNYTADEGPYELSDVLLAVAVASFLSGFFTSYFAK